MSEAGRPRVIIGGPEAARALAEAPVEITPIDPRNYCLAAAPGGEADAAATRGEDGSFEAC